MKTLIKKAGIVVAAAAAGALSFAPLAFAGTAVSGASPAGPAAPSEKCVNKATQTNNSPATAIGVIAAAVSAAVPVNAAANAASCDNISILNGNTVGVGILGTGVGSASNNGSTVQS